MKLTLPLQTKKFYNTDIDKRIADLLSRERSRVPGEVMFLADMTAALQQLRWFWDWLQGQFRPSHQDFLLHRGILFGVLKRLRVKRLPPCFHYLFCHLWEDHVRFGSLKLLIGEAGEASHARDNFQKRPTCRGRQSERDVWNTWAIMLRNFYAERSLVRSGVLLR